MDERFAARTGYTDVAKWLEWPTREYFENYYCVFVLSKDAPEEIRKAAIRESLNYFYRGISDCMLTIEDIFEFNDKDEIIGIKTTGGFVDDAKGIIKWIERGELSRNPREWNNI